VRDIHVVAGNTNTKSCTIYRVQRGKLGLSVIFVTVTGKSDCNVLPTRCCLPVPAYSQSDSCWR